MQKIVPPDATLIPDDAERVFSGILFDVYHWEQELLDGTKKIYEGLRRADTVLAIAVDENGDILINCERQPHRGETVGLPGGRVDASDSSTLDAVKREVAEETGYTFNNWRLVQVIKHTFKIDWFIYIYVATGVRAKTDQRLDSGGELITVEHLPFADAVSRLNTTGSLPEITFLKQFGSLEELLAAPEYEGVIVDVEAKIER